MNRLLKLTANLKGRDFVIGDIHGKFAEFMEALDEVNFDKQIDRVIAVGDLIDRGYGNMQMLALIGEPWFYTVIGNHEIMMADAIEETATNAEYMHWINNGGSWWFKLEEAEQEELRVVYKPLIEEELPIAIELIAKNGKRVGITHTDTPLQWPWWEVCKHMQNLVKLDNVVQHVLWSRTKSNNKNFKQDVYGVELMVHGHTPSMVKEWRGNAVYIDLGYYNKLRLIPVMELMNELEERKNVKER